MGFESCIVMCMGFVKPTPRRLIMPIYIVVFPLYLVHSERQSCHDPNDARCGPGLLIIGAAMWMACLTPAICPRTCIDNLEISNDRSWGGFYVSLHTDALFAIMFW